MFGIVLGIEGDALDSAPVAEDFACRRGGAALVVGCGTDGISDPGRGVQELSLVRGLKYKCLPSVAIPISQPIGNPFGPTGGIHLLSLVAGL